MSRINVANFRHPDGTDDNISLDSSGQVGIGAASPKTKLHVQQSAVSSAPTRAAALYLENNANCELQFVGNSSNDCQLRFGTSSNSFKGALEYQLDVDALLAYTNGTERARITSTGDLRFNSGYGSVATAYGCRAWVNFNGTGTVAIRGSGNVSSITDRNTGRYTVNMTNAMPDSNYAPIFFCGNGGDDDRAGAINVSSTSAFTVSCSDQGPTDNSYTDALNVYCAAFR